MMSALYVRAFGGWERWDLQWQGRRDVLEIRFGKFELQQNIQPSKCREIVLECTRVRERAYACVCLEYVKS